MDKITSKIFHSINFGKSGGSSVFKINPTRNFKVLIISCFLLLVCLAVFNLYFFRQVQSNSLFEVQTNDVAPIQKVNEKKLESILSRYKEKETNTTGVSKLVSPSIDPSR